MKGHLYLATESSHDAVIYSFITHAYAMPSRPTCSTGKRLFLSVSLEPSLVKVTSERRLPTPLSVSTEPSTLVKPLTVQKKVRKSEQAKG